MMVRRTMDYRIRKSGMNSRLPHPRRWLAEIPLRNESHGFPIKDVGNDAELEKSKSPSAPFSKGELFKKMS